MKMDLALKLRQRDKQFSDLLSQWKVVTSRICENEDNAGLSNYSIRKGEIEDDELRFDVFGLRFFMRFCHNFERGTIEYGIIRRNDIDEHHTRVPVVTLHFDRLGNLSAPFSLYPVSEYEKVHLQVLASYLDDFLTAACAETEMSE